MWGKAMPKIRALDPSLVFTNNFYLYYNDCSISPKSTNVSHPQFKPQNWKTKISENPIFMTILGKKMAIKHCPYVL